MQNQKFNLRLLICLFFFSALYVQASAENILLDHSNNPIPFDKVDASVIRDASTKMIALSDARIKAIVAVPSGKQTLKNTLMAMDELLYDITDLQSKLGVISATYQNDSTRNVSSNENDKLSNYSSNINLNEALYKALKSFNASDEAKTLTGSQKKFITELLLNFEKNGMKLSADERKKIEAINNKLITLATSFDRNIAESKDSVEFTEADLKGVSAESRNPWKRANGKYMVYVNGPNSITISQYAESNAARKIMYIHYNNRAYPKNISVLDSLLYYRNLLAGKLGFKSYAEYSLVNKMAAIPATVWAFENDLVAKLTPHAKEELAVLKSLKHQLHPEETDSVFAWDISYYTKKLLDTKYQLNTDEVKEYFEMNNTIKGLFSVYETLFSIQIKETQDQPRWNAKVKSFELLKNGKKIGTFYFDLYPRLNKYTHFACFPISQSRVVNGQETLPVSALICNFPEGTETTPSLLNHSEVITLFHEFGHLVHSLLARSEIAMQGPFNVKGDFVEAPSQFLENWCWEYSSLKMFAKHYKTGAVLPEELFKKMKASQLVNSGINYLRQVYLGTLDFTYEDKYNETKTKGIVPVFKDVFKLNQIPFPDGSYFICSFGHLNGYGANYYGYLWSKVFAQDMFSVFEKNGVMDTKTGLKYRQEVLEKGSTIQEMEMLRSFLGREPNSNAFLKSLGL